MSVLRGAFFLLLTQPVTWMASLLGVVVAPHVLGPQGYGQYALVGAVVALAATAACMGVQDYLVRRVAVHPDSAADDASSALVLTTVTSALAAIGLFFALRRASFPVPSTLLVVALLGIPCGAWWRVLGGVLLGQERHAFYALLLGAVSGGSILAGLVALFVTKSVIACVGTTSLIITAFAAYGWHRLRIGLFTKGFTPRSWPRLAWGGIPFAAAALTVGLYGGIDNVLLGFFARAEVAGWYAAAYRIISMPVFIPTLLITPLFPALSRQAADRAGFRRTVEQCLNAMLYTSLPICAVIIALAPSVPSTLRWAPSFANSIPLIQILALHQPLVATDMVLVTALAAMSRERRWLWVTAFLAIANPLSNLFLIPLFESHAHNGAIGAAIATVATEAMAFIGALLLLPRATVSTRSLRVGVRAVIAATCAGIAASGLRTVAVPVALAAAAVVYASLGVVLGLWAVRDLSQGYATVRRALRNRLPTALGSSESAALD